MRAAVGMHTRERRPFLDVRLGGGAQAVIEDGVRSRVLDKDGRNPFASATATHFGDFLDALDKGTAPPAAVADNRRSLALVFAAVRSAEEGRAVDVGP
jgi:predicted dehydrogenase